MGVNSKPENESKKEILYSFKSIKSANEYIDTLDLKSLGENRETVASNNAILDDNNEHLAVAIRKVLSAKVHTHRSVLKAKFQGLFDVRVKKDLKPEIKASNLNQISILKRAMRTATDSDANKRGLWEFDYSVTCNTIKNNGIAKFQSIDYKTDGDDDEKSKPIVTDADQVFEYVVHRMNNKDFKALALIVETRFVLEQQNYDSDDIIFVDAIGNKPPHFKLKESA